MTWWQLTTLLVNVKHTAPCYRMYQLILCLCHPHHAKVNDHNTSADMNLFKNRNFYRGQQRKMRNACDVCALQITLKHVMKINFKLSTTVWFKMNIYINDNERCMMMDRKGGVWIKREHYYNQKMYTKTKCIDTRTI